MMDEHGLCANHSTIRRWVFNYSPQLEQKFRKRKKPVGQSCRLDAAYIKIRGQLKYLYPMPRAYCFLALEICRKTI